MAVKKTVSKTESKKSVKFQAGGSINKLLVSKEGIKPATGEGGKLMKEIHEKKIMRLDIDPTISPDSRLHELLQKQVTHEFDNERLYQAMSLWSANHGYYETAKFYNAHMGEERRHGMDFVNFMVEQGMKVEAPAPKTQPSDFDCMGDLIMQSMEREKETTRMIEEIHSEALKPGNGAALTIAGKYLAEQVEEEQLFRSLANLFMMANGSRMDFEMEVMKLKDKKPKYKIGNL